LSLYTNSTLKANDLLFTLKPWDYLGPESFFAQFYFIDNERTKYHIAVKKISGLNPKEWLALSLLYQLAYIADSK
jgi:hypothetical protein